VEVGIQPKPAHQDSQLKKKHQTPKLLSCIAMLEALLLSLVWLMYHTPFHLAFLLLCSFSPVSVRSILKSICGGDENCLLGTFTLPTYHHPNTIAENFPRRIAHDRQNRLALCLLFYQEGSLWSE
jgi:hypothetical protein